MLHKALQNKWVRVLIAVFATFLYALGVNLFIVPMGLYSGGVVGLSQVIRTLLMQQSVICPRAWTSPVFFTFSSIFRCCISPGATSAARFLLRTLICVGASSFF